MSWGSRPEAGPHSEVPSFSLFPLLVSCGFYGILSPGSRSEYNPGLTPTLFSYPASTHAGRGEVWERLEGVLGYRVWGSSGWHLCGQLELPCGNSGPGLSHPGPCS